MYHTTRNARRVTVKTLDLQVLFVYLEECDSMMARYGVQPTVRPS